ncbi:MAG: DUF2807 domain-containing protein [Bacteroidia bacterium]|nr:DUF2807 domain-containing protein [Bacteroidia bacterium]
MKLHIEVKLLFYLLFLFSFFIYSCKEKNICNCLKRTGRVVTAENHLPEFHNVVIKDMCYLYLEQDTINKIKITCGNNLLPLIKYDILDDTLYISNHNICTWSRSYKEKIEIFVTFQSLKCLRIESGCDIQALDTISENELMVEVWGRITTTNLLLHCNIFRLNLHAANGDYTLSGASNIFYLYNVGTGYVFADRLITEISYITSNSDGDSYVNVSKELDAQVLGKGNVYYSGNPEKIKILETYKGRVINIP